MDDFGMLARDFGYRPQGKSAPMASSKAASVDGTLNFGIGSGGAERSRSSLNKLNSSFNDRDPGDGLLFDDVFGGPPKYNSSSASDILGGKGGSSRSGDEFDSLFQGSNLKHSSMPKFDKPVYDDDIFDGLPGVKSTSSSSVKYDDVFASMSSSPPNYSATDNSAFDDLLGNFVQKETLPKSSREKVEKDAPVFDDLLPGFGGSGTPSTKRKTSEASQFQKTSSNSATTNVMEDPFVVLESTSSPVNSTSGLFTDPLEEIGRFSSYGKTRHDSSSVNEGIFDDTDPLDSLGKSVPPVSFESKYREKDRSPVKTGPNRSGTQSPSDEPIDKYPLETSENQTPKVPVDNFQESGQTVFDMPYVSTDFRRSVGQTTSSPSYVNVSPTETNSQVDMSPKSEDNLKTPDDVWLTVSEIPLFTEPTSAPPPSRPPPPRPARGSKSATRSFASSNTKEKVNEFSSFPSSTQYSHSQKAASASVGSPSSSQIDELEDFAMGRTWNNVNESVNAPSVEEVDTNSVAAAAMKDAMDRAEAKFRHAKDMREREHLKAAKSKEAVPNKDEKAMHDSLDRDLREKQGIFDGDMYTREKEEEREQRRLERERERAKEMERGREEKEREQRRLEKERERAREIEREREKARQAVERATREARERAAVEARLRAEKAAVEKANAEARERAERAAVQRAQAEARERAAVEARERAEKAAAEAREREAREKASASRARAEAEARNRAERAAVERAAAEARERAAADARERAAAAARANQQKDDNDLESFFSMGSRPSSAPRPRANSSDPLFDTQAQSKGRPEVPRRTSVGTSSNMRKASSATNIVDDLTSIFGAAPSAGDFQEVEGESEDRRRSRLERHQRTQDRAAKALAEKNQRDLQVQREQAERHRISETLDAEIKRWSAGKEGNIRALLSTMQYVLWPECGWQPVSLTDLITGASVKKVYRKATLCIHPDKVQQKGANLQQKYIAEKVFDLLKEAWNKFNSEELF